jgi:hypothetical protein
MGLLPDLSAIIDRVDIWQYPLPSERYEQTTAYLPSNSVPVPKDTFLAPKNNFSRPPTHLRCSCRIHPKLSHTCVVVCFNNLLYIPTPRPADQNYFPKEARTITTYPSRRPREMWQRARRVEMAPADGSSHPKTILPMPYQTLQTPVGTTVIYPCFEMAHTSQA